jgi:hypothetical protein
MIWLQSYEIIPIPPTLLNYLRIYVCFISEIMRTFANEYLNRHENETDNRDGHDADGVGGL